MCKILIEKFNGKVPTTREDLMSLPGVGRKCTDIMMRFVYNEPAVPVDTHVHRLANRLGLCETKTEAKTAEYLEKNIPLDYKWGAHMWFITHGKYVCKARPPQCAKCFLKIYCKHYNLTTAEEIARCWNGGPSGSSHHRTKCYWNKVRKELDLLAYYH